MPGEVTSQAGWPPEAAAHLRQAVTQARAAGMRVSLFVDPTAEAVEWAKDHGADRVELFTEPFARAFNSSLPEGRDALRQYIDAAQRAHALGLGINAGHDLDLHNLPLFCEVPYLDEVSIGHALMCDALEIGLAGAVSSYLRVLGS